MIRLAQQQTIPINNSIPIPAVLITALASGSGKTHISMGLIEVLKQLGYSVAPYKIGPDYIDASWLGKIAQSPCYHLDGFAMDNNYLKRIWQIPDKKANLDNNHAENPPVIKIVEGVMGFYDGAKNGKGSSYEMAKLLQIPILLVVRTNFAAKDSVDAMAEQQKTIKQWLQDWQGKVVCLGIIINGDNFTKKAVWQAWYQSLQLEFSKPPLYFLPILTELTLPSRHLGLVQAIEMVQADNQIAIRMAEILKEHLPESFWQVLTKNLTVEEPIRVKAKGPIENWLYPNGVTPLKKTGKVLAVAYDKAFNFFYPHVIAHWLEQGLQVKFFSPLANEILPKNTEWIFLPGGYPEIFLPELAKAEKTKHSIWNFIKTQTAKEKYIYGECGGFMWLGQGIIDKTGKFFPTLALLPQVTSFYQPKLHLGYRHLTMTNVKLAAWLQQLFGVSQKQPMPKKFYHWYGHEFHYSQELSPAELPTELLSKKLPLQKKLYKTIEPLFQVTDSLANPIPNSSGYCQKFNNSNVVLGSYHHIIC